MNAPLPMREPSPENAYQRAYAALLQDSYRRWTGRELLGDGTRDGAAAERLFRAPVAVLAHDTAADPHFVYANATALTLFGLTWAQLVATPSRHSAEPMHREARARLLERVTAQGYIDDYSGIRIARDGRRFRIRQATVWNVVDAAGVYQGQAATFAAWEWLPSAG